MYKSKPSSKSSLKRTASNMLNKTNDLNYIAKKELEDKNMKLMNIEMNFETISQICAAEKEKNFRLQERLKDFEHRYEQLYHEMNTKYKQMQTFEGHNQSLQFSNETNDRLTKDVESLKSKLEKAQRDVNLKALDVINLEKELNNVKVTLSDTEKELAIKEKYIRDCDSDVTRYVNENKNLKQDNVRLAQMYQELKDKLESFCGDKKEENDQITEKINYISELNEKLMAENMELVEELNSLKPNYFALSDKVNKLAQDSAESQEMLKQTNNVLEKLRETHSKTISSFEEVKEQKRQTHDKLSALQLQFDLKVRDLNNAYDEIAEYKTKMSKFSNNSSTAIEKLELEYKQTINDLQMDFSKILNDKESEMMDMRNMHDRDRAESKLNIEELNKQVRSLVVQLSAFDNVDLDSYNRLNDRYLILNQNLELAKEENRSLKSSNKIYSEENRKLKEGIESELDGLQTELLSVRKDLEGCKIEKDILRESDQQSTTKIKELEKIIERKANVDSQLKDLEKRLFKEEIKNREILEEKNKMQVKHNNEIKEYKSTIIKLNDQLKNYEDKQSDLNKGYDEHYNKLQLEKENIENKLKELEKKYYLDVDKLTDENKDYSKTVYELTKSIESLTTKLNKSNEEYELANGVKNEMETQIWSLNKEIASLNSSLKTLKKMEETESTCKFYVMKLADLKNIIMEYTDDLLNNEKPTEEKEQLTQDLKAKVVQLHNQIDTLISDRGWKD